MKMRTLLLLTCLFGSLIPAIGQDDTETIDAQFVDVIEKSNRYEDYKVVKIYKLNNLRKNVKDSIAAIEANLEAANTTIEQQQNDISTLTNDVTSLQGQLTESKAKENGIDLFGSLIKKSTYKTTMWSVIGFLGLILVFLFFKFKNSNAVTREAKMKLAEIEAEFEEHRQKNLEQQQVLRRKLQDEINKNKKM